MYALDFATFASSPAICPNYVKHAVSTVTEDESPLEKSSKSSAYTKWEILNLVHFGWKWKSYRVVLC